MQEYRPDEGWQEPEEATPAKIGEALKRGSDVTVFDGGNRKARRAAAARYRRSQNRKKRGSRRGSR